MLRAARLLLAAALLPCPFLPAQAEIVVVMSARSPINVLSRDEIINIFMGRYRHLPDGTPAIPLDAPLDSEERKLFYRRLLNRSPEEINVYWARLVFSGRTRPPHQVAGTQAMIAELAEHPQMVGYIERKQLTRDLRVVFSLGD